MSEKAKSTKGSNKSVQKPLKPKPLIKDGLQFGLGNPSILLIAPHGVMGDDDRTDIVAFEAQQQLKCYAIINKRIKRDEYDLNSFKSGSGHPTFIKEINRIVHIPKFKLVVWIHGGDENGEKWQGAIDAGGFDCEPEAIDAFIGYGQGNKPVPPETEPNDRPTAKKEIVEALCKHLTAAGLVSVETGRGAPSYRGYNPDNMNQHLNRLGISLDQAESIQIEIRNKGFRDNDENARKTATIITQALVQLFPHYAEKRDANLAEQAYQELSGLFKKHITAFMLEAGQYIIGKFYGGNARLALAKNKSKDNPPSLKLLIDKLKAAPNNPSENAPSVSWFYKAVNMAAHEAIFKQMGLSTFTILGHSHKLQLLNVPPLKQIDGDKFDEEIEPNFIEKERLAKHAINNELTVRKFKEYLDKEYPSEDDTQIDLNNLLSRDDLVKKDPKELILLWNNATKKIEESQQLIGTYGTNLNTLETVLAEKGTGPVERKGRFKDWTENNFNICRGCSNDCLYCYAKPGINFRCKVEKGKWHQMEIVEEKVQQPQRLKNGLVGFPSTHDIVPGKVLDAYLTVLGKLLRAGNEVLIVTKPRLECIKAICNASPFFKDKILFRFTIGAMTDDTLGFWEPNAPTYQDRKDCLQYAYDNGFRTSVSMEPLLAMDQVHEMIADLRSYVSEDIWIGTMNHLTEMKKDADEVLRKKIDQVEMDQSPEALRALYDVYKNDKLIKWKTDALKAIFGDGKAEFKWDKKEIKLDTGETKDIAAPVIISATRRSDIPAFYADEFMEALRRGHTQYLHRGNQINVSFDNTRFIVFWTKNPRPMMFQHLDEIDQLKLGCYFLYTLNDYEKEGLEPGLPALQERIDTFKKLAGRIGKERVVWRFDPLILADKISSQALIDKVGSVMTQLAGHTEKLVFSFLDPDLYNARNKLKAAGYEARAFSEDEKAYIAKHIAEMAEKNGIQAAACAEPMSLSEYGILDNKCIDDALIRRVFSQDAKLMSFLDSVKGIKDNGQRKLCCCVPSYDIGTGNTCQNGCVYSYANASEEAVQNQLKRISNESEIPDLMEDANDSDPPETISINAIVSGNSKTLATNINEKRIQGEFTP